ncbi:hypothetical protein KEM56_003462 [Ascosphaera pollenicola]|nr:hypothetical protein KEM56_003462 [Ascosphaera pollenicola]
MMFSKSTQLISALIAATASAYPFPGTAVAPAAGKQVVPTGSVAATSNGTNQTATEKFPAPPRLPYTKRNETVSHLIVDKRNETAPEYIVKRNESVSDEVESVKTAILKRNETADALESIEKSQIVARNETVKRNETVTDHRRAASTAVPNVVRKNQKGTGVVPPRYT